MRKWTVLLVVMLLAAACGDSGGVGESQAPLTAAVGAESTITESVTEQSADPADTEPTAATEQVAPSSESDEVAAPEPSVAIEGPAAPDFTLALGNGGTYTLSEGAKPVYLVFWAEW